MKERLEELVKNAYAPYSKFKVACFVETKDGKFFPGVNVENANYTSICAERNAISYAVSQGYKKGDFEALHLFLESDTCGWPCMACRQVILEFFAPDKKIICYYGSETCAHTVSELCPLPFTSEDLK